MAGYEDVARLRAAARSTRLRWVRGLVMNACAYLFFAFLSKSHFEGREAGWVAANGVLYFVAGGAALAVHEGAHALVAQVLGLKVFGVVVGLGPRLWSGLVRGRWVQLNAVPLLGLTLVAPPSRRAVKLRMWAVYAAGPLSNLLVLWAMGPARNWATGISDGPAPLQLFWIWNALLLVNLVPMRVASPSGKALSDGAQLLAFPFASKERIDKLLASYFALEALARMLVRDLSGAEQWYRRGLREFPDSTLLQHDLTVPLMQSGRFAEARLELLRLLDKEPSNSPIRPMVLNNIAWSDLNLEDESLLDEAARMSEEALAAQPQIPALQGTRGAILVVQGNLEPGLELLQSAFNGNDAHPAKAHNACWLAIGEARRQRVDEARRWLGQAVSLDPTCPSLVRARREVLPAAQPR